MLAQTTVATVIPYYKRWVKVFPDIKTLARAPLEKVLKTWQGLGYYQRVRNIHRSAKIIYQEHGGLMPRAPEVLRELPGFGPYTTGAVLSIAFGQRQPIIDANIRRVVLRLTALQGHAGTKNDKAVLNFLEKAMPQKNAGIFNQALMELGQMVCRPSVPLCLSCPIRSFCLAYKKGLQDIIPETRKKTVHKIEAVAGIIKKRGSYFIQKRPPSGLLAGLWEFPGGKIEPGESPKEAIARELKEELGVRLVSGRHLTILRHSYTKFSVRLHAWSCRVAPLPREDKTHKWVRRKAFNKIPMPSATVKIIESLVSH